MCMCARLCLQPSEKDRRRQKLADRCPCTRLIRLAARDFCAHMPIADIIQITLDLLTKIRCQHKRP